MDMDELYKLKKAQEELKAQLSSLEESVSRGYGENMRELVETTLKQSKKVAERMEYLLNLLIDAAKSEDVSERLLKTIAKAQVDLIDGLMEIKDKVKEGALAKQDLEELKSKLEALSREIGDVAKREELKGIMEKIVEIEDRISKIEQSESIEAPALNELKKDVGALKERIEHLEEELKTREPLLEGLKTKIDGIETRLVGLEKAIQPQLNQALKGLKESLEKAREEDLGKIEVRISDIEKMVDEWKQWKEIFPMADAQLISEIKQMLEKKKREYPYLGGQIKFLEERVEKIEKMLKNMERLKEIEKKIKMLEKIGAEVEEQREIIEEIKRSLDLLKKEGLDVEKLERKVEEWEKRVIEEHEREMEMLIGMVKKMEERVEKVEKLAKEIDALYERIIEMGRKQRKRAKEIEEVEKKLQSLERKMGKVVTKEGLDEILKTLELIKETKLVQEKKGLKKEVEKLQGVLKEEQLKKLEEAKKVAEKSGMEKVRKRLEKVVEKARQTPVKLKIEEQILNAFGDKIKLADLAEKMGMDREALLKILKKMEKNGNIQLKRSFFDKILGRIWILKPKV